MGLSKAEVRKILAVSLCMLHILLSLAAYKIRYGTPSTGSCLTIIVLCAVFWTTVWQWGDVHAQD